MQALTDTQMSRNYWWLMGIRGVLAVLFGLAALVLPGLTLLVLVYLFGAYALIDGITAVVVALQERTMLRQWWVLLLEGIAGILFGVLTFFWPAMTAFILLYLIAVWAILTGVLEIAAAFSRRLPMALEWSLGVAGVLSVIFGLILIIFPGAGILSLLWLIGVYALIFGVLLIIRAFQFRAGAAA